MTDPFIDTNILVHYVTGDDPEKQERTAHLLEVVEAGKQRVIVPLTVFADTIHVLCSPRIYNRPPSEVAVALTPWVRCPHFKIKNRRMILLALNLFATGTLDFDDAMIVASMRQVGSQVLFSYDQDFDRIEGLTRKEPSA